jgi:hypothetical protein
MFFSRSTRAQFRPNIKCIKWLSPIDLKFAADRACGGIWQTLAGAMWRRNGPGEDFRRRATSYPSSPGICLTRPISGRTNPRCKLSENARMALRWSLRHPRALAGFAYVDRTRLRRQPGYFLGSRRNGPAWQDHPRFHDSPERLQVLELGDGGFTPYRQHIR